jgi:long-chain acyl-CoA synthetase
MAFHFVVSIVLYVRVGAAIAISRDFLAETMLDYSNRFKATLLYASPMHIRLLSGYAGVERLDSLRMVISTSTAISAADIKSFTEKYQKPISQAYGIIEIGLPIINHLNPEQNPEAVGYALPSYRVEILDDDNNILPPGEIGHLAISGPGMFDGYLSPPTLRQEILNGSWFMTGDLASKDLSGLITVRGRKKSMINVSGNKVFPEEVEHVLNAHPDVKESRVFGGKHILLGEVVQAEVVSANGREDVEVLISFCREKLSTYKVPQRISFVKELQRTETGKLKR